MNGAVRVHEDGEAAMNDQVEPAVEKLQGYVTGFFWILPNLGIALAVFLLFLLAAWLGRHAVTSLFHRRGNEDLGRLLGGFARWSLVLLGLLVVATIVFPSVKPADLLATFGIGSVAIGLAFKDILQNWLSGLLILYRQPFRPGDQIVSGSFEGTVEAIEARATLLRTYDGQRIVIPNSDIYTRAVTVRTAFAKRRSEYDLGIGYGDDVERACRVILDAMGGIRGVERAPAPEAIPWALDDSSVRIRVRWWTDPRQHEVVLARGRVVAMLRQALGRAGIDLPFPTQVLLFHDQTEETDGDRARQREGWPAGGSPPRPRRLESAVLATARLGNGQGEPLADRHAPPARRA
jgi:small-conductance mechanosensitive channel